MQYIGYHGTSIEYRTQILRLKGTGFTESASGWLGPGIYFFDNDYNMAHKFASKKYRTVGVLECEIDVPDDKIIDLTNAKSHNNLTFHAIRDSLISLELQKRNMKRTSEKGNNAEDFDNTTFKMLYLRKGYKLVRANTYTYTKNDNSVKQLSRIPNGVELCLRDQAYIKSKGAVSKPSRR